MAQQNSLEVKIIRRIAREINGSEGTSKRINKECENDTRATVRQMRRLLAEWQVKGGEREAENSQNSTKA